MFRFMRGLVKWGVIGGLGLAGLVAIVGLPRVKAAWWSVKDHLRSNVDDIVDTRVALEHEVRKLQEEYPERIAKLRIQIRDIDRDLAECRDSIRFSEEVVALARSDQGILERKLAALGTEEGDGRIVNAVVDFRSERMAPDMALSRANRAAETILNHESRLADLAQEEQLLAQEKAAMEAELASLIQEREEFQAQIGSLKRDISSLERKQALVELAERRRGEKEDVFSDHASSLATVREMIERKRIEYDERLKSARIFAGGNEYEMRARMRLAGSGD